MKILILEDNEERIEFFKKIYKNHTLYITKDLDDAQRMVYNLELDVLFLDHDLEPDNFKAMQAGRTGYDLVKFLVNNKLQKQAVIYVHSMNPVGGQTMANVLKENGYEANWIPYNLLKKEDR